MAMGLRGESLPAKQSASPGCDWGVIRQLQRELFLPLEQTYGATPEALAQFMERRATVLAARYPGLECVRLADIPQRARRLIEEQLQLLAGQWLVEIGPGPRGGIGLIAALMGLHVVMVEYDQQFHILPSEARSQLMQVGLQVSANIARVPAIVDPLARLQSRIVPYSTMVEAAGGSVAVVSGDFSSPEVQEKVLNSGTFHHVVATDVIDPGRGNAGQTLAATTTSDPDRITSILTGIASLATHAKRLYVSFIAPEESIVVGDNICAFYGVLEPALRKRGLLTGTYDRVISPSSGGLVNARNYRFDRSAVPPV